MKKGKNTFAKFQETLNHVGSNFHIMEECIDVNTQKEYFNYSFSLKDQESEKIDEAALCMELLAPQTPVVRQRHLLVLLASTSSIPCYRCIEQYMKDPAYELRDWALMAKNESFLHVQTSFLEEKFIFISSGLGGKNKKLRYFVILSAKSGSMEEYQQNLVLGETEFLAKNVSCEIENIGFTANFVKILILIPVKTNISALFEHLIKNINVFGDFMNSAYIVTNIRIIPDDQISETYNKKLNERVD